MSVLRLSKKQRSRRLQRGQCAADRMQGRQRSFEQLEARLYLSNLYNYSVIAQTAPNGLTSIQSGASINDSGEVAFVASNAVGESVYVGTQIVSFAAPNSAVTYGAEVKINDSGQVAAVDSESGQSCARIWNTDGSNSIVARSSNPPADNTEFTGIGSFASISNDGKMCFGGLVVPKTGASIWNIYLGNTLVSANGAATPTASLTSPAFFRMMAANGGYVVVGSNPPSQPKSIVLYGPGSSVTIASTAAGWSNLGVRPGISDDGQLVTFYGVLTAAGATTINAAQPTFAPLQPGTGIFAEINTVTHGRVIIEVDQEQFGPGEAPLGAISNFDANTRVGVTTIHPSVPGGHIESFTVVFMGTDAATGSDGLFCNRVDVFGSVSDPTSFRTNVNTPIAEVGDSVNGVPGAITSLSVNDPVNNQGQVAFEMNTGASASAVVVAQPAPISAVTYYNQGPAASLGGGPWATQVYAYGRKRNPTGYTIQLKGCNLCALTMAVDYADNPIGGPVYDPGTMNAQLLKVQIPRVSGYSPYLSEDADGNVAGNNVWLIPIKLQHHKTRLPGAFLGFSECETLQIYWNEP